MKKKLIIILVTFFLFSCKKFVDTKPVGYIIPVTLEDYEMIMTASEITQILSSDLDNLSDDYFPYWLVDGLSEKNVTAEANIYYWRNDIYISPEEIGKSPWVRLYAGIYQCNAVLEGMAAMKVLPEQEQRKKKLQSVARVYRAIYFWYLANLYCQPYTSASQDVDLGVPLVTTTNIVAALPGRGTLQQTNSFIEKEWIDAMDGLALESPDLFQPSKLAVWGWLARHYLFTQQNAKAVQACDSVLKYRPGLVDLNRYYTVSSTGKKQYSRSLPYLKELTNPENVAVMYYSSPYDFQAAELPAQTRQYFSDNDLRRLFWTEYYNSYYQEKYYYYFDKDKVKNNIGITTPELYLIRAEAQARSGKLPSALNDVNRLRSHRIDSSYYEPIESDDQKEVLKLILAERRCETLYKGVRWFDMRRLNSDSDFGFTAYRDRYNGPPIQILPGSSVYTLRIPATAIGDNILQNP